MSNYIVQQEDVETILSSKRTVYVRAELLNKQFKTIEWVEGELQADDFSYNSDTDIRKTMKLVFVLKDASFTVGRDKKIWFDKYLRLHEGVEHVRTGEIRWYSIGLFCINTANYSYDATTNTVSLSLVDRVAELDGTLGGVLSGQMTAIYPKTDDGKDNTIQSALVSTITQLGGVSKYRIDTIKENIPYDLEFEIGSTVWDIIVQLRDLYPGYEAFFDEECFVCQKLPTLEIDPVVIDANTLSQLIISDETNVQFGSIKNVTEVWGKCLSSDYYTDTVTMSGATYTLTYSALGTINNGTQFAFKASNNNISGSRISVNGLVSGAIVGEQNVPIPAGKLSAGSAYVVRYVVNGSTSLFYLMGQYQISALTKLVSKTPSNEKKNYDLLNEPTSNISYIIDPSSPFCSDFEDVGERRQVLSGGEYDNIYSDELALQRAEYENWKSTDFLNTISLNMIEIPWLDVNQKIEYRSPDTGEINQYIVQSKSGSTMSGTMSVTCRKFQKLYPWTN